MLRDIGLRSDPNTAKRGEMVGDTIEYLGRTGLGSIFPEEAVLDSDKVRLHPALAGQTPRSATLAFRQRVGNEVSPAHGGVKLKALGE